MEKLQAGITLGGIILSCFLTHFLAKKREVKANKKTESSLSYATQIDTYRNASQIEKDRFAQLVFDCKDITFCELEYFIQYENADKWVSLYLLHKKNIKLERANNTLIQYIYSKYSLTKYLISIFVALVLFVFAMLPFLSWKKYISVFQQNLLSQDYLFLFNIVVYPILLLVSTVILFSMAENMRYSKKFVKNFYASALKTE